MQDYEPTFAVVIPAYNRARFIGTAIESALAQTVVPNEIIVVDDGSTDDTAKIVKQYPRPVRLLTIENNGSGPSRPRNVGIEAAKSQFITLLDSDDFLSPELIAHHRRLVKTYSEIGLVTNSYSINRCGNVRRVSANIIASLEKKAISDSAFFIRSEVAYPAYCAANFIKTPGTTIPKTAWRKCGMFDESLRTSNDFDFFVRILSKYHMIYIDRPLATIVHHDGNISGSNVENPVRPELAINHLRVQKREYTKIVDQKARRALRRSIGKYLLYSGYAHRESGQYSQAARSYFECLRWRTQLLPSAWGMAKLLVILLGRATGLFRRSPDLK